MKNIIIRFLKKHYIYLIIQTVFIFLNIYFATYPAKIIGNLIDLIYDILEKYGKYFDKEIIEIFEQKKEAKLNKF